MKWLPVALGGTRFTSECQRYELRARWDGSHFAWRGRFIATDELVWSSADRSHVEQRCEAHAAAIDAEVPA